MRLSQICIAIAQLGRGGAWSPLALWPDGIDTPGMWISPRTLTSEWQDYTGTTPVATPGTVADSANPVGLSLDIRAGAPEVLGPELVVNGDFSDGTTGWTPDIEQGLDTVLTADTSIFPSGGMKLSAPMYPGGGQTISGLVVGTLYEVNASIYSDSLRASIVIGNNYAYTSVSQVNEVNDLSLRFVATATSMVVWVAKVIPAVGWSSGDLYVSNISVKEVPGNHMLQSTSAARPLMSARVNALQYTENLSAGYWGKYATATWGADYIQETAATQAYGFGPTGSPLSGVDAITLKAKVKAGIRSKIYFGVVGAGNMPGTQFVVDIAAKSATITNQGGSVGAFSYVEDGDWLRVSCSTTGMASATTSIQIIAVAGNLSYPFSYAGTDGEIALYVTELSLTPTELADLPYQSIPGDGSTYATDFPIFQKYDGVDDGMATAAFTAGTLTSAMDCMIAVRRDSAALPAIGGLYQADQTKYFGVLGVISGDAASTYGGCGAPSVFVDGVAVANTRGALFDALTVGDFHILEYRGLDLSAWVDAGWGAYPTYLCNGARGDILLYPSTASTEDKDAARQYLADYYGVTLP